MTPHTPFHPSNGPLGPCPARRPRAAWPLLLLVLLGLNGCAGLIIPVPSREPTAIAGTLRNRSDFDFIVPGRTTLTELRERLGPGRLRGDRRALSYSWEEKGGDLYGAVVVASPGGSGAGARKLGNAWTRWRAQFIELDAQGTVLASDHRHLRTRKSLDQQLDEWLAHNEKKRARHPASQPDRFN